MSSRPALYSLIAAASLSLHSESALAASIPAALAFGVDAGITGPIQVGDRWYPLDDYDYPPEYYPPPPAYYRPPPPPERFYRAPPLPPPQEYEPPVYGWSYAPPPQPSSCGVYRFWNGERCADARDELPYIGPRW
jgi:hypothetical protein